MRYCPVLALFCSWRVDTAAVHFGSVRGRVRIQSATHRSLSNLVFVGFMCVCIYIYVYIHIKIGIGIGLDINIDRVHVYIYVIQRTAVASPPHLHNTLRIWQQRNSTNTLSSNWYCSRGEWLKTLCPKSFDTPAETLEA